MVMFAMVVRMIVLLLTLFYLVPTISTERAKTIMKIPWAPIPVTSLPQLGLNRVYIASGLAFLGSAKILSQPILQIAFFLSQNQTVVHNMSKSKLEEPDKCVGKILRHISTNNTSS